MQPHTVDRWSLVYEAPVFLSRIGRGVALLGEPREHSLPGVEQFGAVWAVAVAECDAGFGEGAEQEHGERR